MNTLNDFTLSEQLSKYMDKLINVTKDITVDHTLTGKLNPNIPMSDLQADMAKIFSLRSIPSLANLLIHIGKSRIVDCKLAESQLRLYCYHDLNQFKYDDLVTDSKTLKQISSSKDRFFVNSDNHVRFLTVNDVSNEIHYLVSDTTFVSFVRKYISEMTLYLKKLRS